MMLLATLAQLSFGSSFERFLPVAGTQTRLFVQRAYVMCVTIALVITVAYEALGLSHSFLPASFGWRALFVAAVVMWTIFALQDSVLIDCARRVGFLPRTFSIRWSNSPLFQRLSEEFVIVFAMLVANETRGFVANGAAVPDDADQRREVLSPRAGVPVSRALSNPPIADSADRRKAIFAPAP
jgi:hypothetical protein